MTNTEPLPNFYPPVGTTSNAGTNYELIGALNPIVVNSGIVDVVNTRNERITGITTNETLSQNSDSLIPTERAVKEYVDAHAAVTTIGQAQIAYGDALGALTSSAAFTTEIIENTSSSIIISAPDAGTTMTLGCEDMTNPAYIDVSTAQLGIGVNGARQLYVNADVIGIPIDTESTDIGSGAVTVSGGIGITKNLNVGGAITSSESLAATPLATSGLIVAGAYGVLGTTAKYAVDNTDTTKGIIVVSSPDASSHLKISTSNSGVHTRSELSTNVDNLRLSTLSTPAIDISSTFVEIIPTTEALSIGGGALRVDGGASVTGNLFVDKKIVATDTIASMGFTATCIPIIGDEYALNTSMRYSTDNTSTTASTLVVSSPSYTVHANLKADMLGDSSSLITNATSMIIGGGSTSELVATTTKVSIVPTTASSSTTTGALVVAGGLGLAKDINIGGLINVSTGGGSIASPISLTGTGAQLYLSNNGANSSSLTSSSTGNLTIACDGHTTNFGSSDSVKVLSTTASTSSTTGALMVAGGMGIVGRLNVGGAITTTDSFTDSSLAESCMVVTGAGGLLDATTRYSIDNTNVSASKVKIYSPNGAKLLQMAVDQLWDVGQIYSTSGTLELWAASNKYLSINPTSTHVYETTQATSNTTGALIVDGGASVTKDLWVGGNLHVNGIVTVTRPSSINLTPYIPGFSRVWAPYSGVMGLAWEAAQSVDTTVIFIAMPVPADMVPGSDVSLEITTGKDNAWTGFVRYEAHIDYVTDGGAITTISGPQQIDCLASAAPNHLYAVGFPDVTIPSSAMSIIVGMLRRGTQDTYGYPVILSTMKLNYMSNR